MTAPFWAATTSSLMLETVVVPERRPIGRPLEPVHVLVRVVGDRVWIVLC